MLAANDDDITETAARMLQHRHPEAWMCLGASGATALEVALLRLYALDDWRQWGVVSAPAAKAAGGWFADQAAADAMNRLLWRRPSITLAARARELRVRADAYGIAVERAEAALRSWLLTASVSYLVALGMRERITPASRQTGVVKLASTPPTPRVAPRYGQQHYDQAA